MVARVTTSWQVSTGWSVAILVVGNSIAEARVRHTKHAPEGIVGASFRIIESLPSISESVNEMRSVKLELYERQALASAALTLRYPDQAPI